MKKRIRVTAIIVCFVLVCYVMYGCGKETGSINTDQGTEEADEGRGDLITDEEQFAESDEEPAANESDVQETSETEPQETEPSDLPETGNESETPYGGPYIDKINELQTEGLADQFTLVNIDEDDIPELVASDSKGSFDHENAFIFTVNNDEVIQLAGVITGVDGGNLDYSAGSNLIHVSGAAAGMRDVFSEIKDGKLEEVFVAEASSMDEDAKYTVNGSSVTEEEYYKQINGFVEKYNPLTRIAYDGLYEITYKYENGYGNFEPGGSEKYGSAEQGPKAAE
jgi:hypothetical protein